MTRCFLFVKEGIVLKCSFTLNVALRESHSYKLKTVDNVLHMRKPE